MSCLQAPLDRIHDTKSGLLLADVTKEIRDGKAFHIMQPTIEAHRSQ